MVHNNIITRSLGWTSISWLFGSKHLIQLQTRLCYWSFSKVCILLINILVSNISDLKVFQVIQFVRQRNLLIYGFPSILIYLCRRKTQRAIIKGCILDVCFSFCEDVFFVICNLLTFESYFSFLVRELRVRKGENIWWIRMSVYLLNPSYRCLLCYVNII